MVNSERNVHGSALARFSVLGAYLYLTLPLGRVSIKVVLLVSPTLAVELHVEPIPG